MFYLAYGSNMAVARLQQRISSAEKLGLVSLSGHRLTFDNYSSKDHSGKCNALQTGNPDDLVIAVLYQLDPSAKQILDRYEGVGLEYRAAFVAIETPQGEPAEALIYYATNLKPGVQPYHWYKEHVLRGAQENVFPTGYLTAIRQVESIADADFQRAERELAIYTELSDSQD